MANSTVVATISAAALIFDSNDDSDRSSDTSSVGNSEADDDDISVELEILYTILMVTETRGEIIRNPQIFDYFERVVPGYSREIFKQHFRMFPETFEMVLATIGPGLRRVNALSGRDPIPEAKQLLIAIWFMATPDSYRSISSRFGVEKATAFRALRRVTYALHCISPMVIKWPRNAVAADVMRQFRRNWDFPNVIGAIDGTHIRIRAPEEDPNSYINRKGFHSINVQVVCDSRGLFTHCYAGQVGSVHDARVFRNSLVARFIEIPAEYFPNDSHIIGDAAYGIHPHVMVPFRNNGHLTNRQNNFNRCLSSTRMAIERPIGSLKIRFRTLLDCLPLTDVKKIPEFILACCVLHNICVSQNDLMVIGVYRQDDELGPIVRNNAVEVGNAKRNRIMNDLPMRI